MSNPKLRSQKRSSGLADVKTLFLSVSVTSILGFWVLFSRQGGLVDTQAEGSTVEGASLPQTASESIAGLPPIPTLAPLYTGGGNPSLAVEPTAVFVTPPSVIAAPSTTSLGDSRPPQRVQKPRASRPVTSTRSSK